MHERRPEMEHSEAFDDDIYKYLHCLKAAAALDAMVENIGNFENCSSDLTCIAFCHVSEAFHSVL